jgi:dihydroorotase
MMMANTPSKSLLVIGGLVFDPIRRNLRRQDVLVQHAKISQVCEGIVPRGGEEVLQASNQLVLPGLIDLHVHCFRYGQVLGVDADEVSPRAGTTTFVDAGSSGSLNFLAFREYVIKPSVARVFAFLNISAIGLQSVGGAGINFAENDDDRLLDVRSAAEVIEKNRDIIVGVKVRAYTGLKSLTALVRAREVADITGLPIMAHIASGPPHFAEVLPFLKAGDIVTHVYHGGDDSLLDGNGRVRDVFKEARARGIEFDVGLDRDHSDFTVIRAGLNQDFTPHYLSTDLTVSNRHVTVDMATTISKFIALGLPLEEALVRSTHAPATKLGKAKEFGTLSEGSDADLGIFELREGDFHFGDTYGNTIQTEKRLVPVATIRNGVVLSPNNRQTMRYDFVSK